MEEQVKFVADEGVEKAIVIALRESYEVICIAEAMQSASDKLILETAATEGRILITLDKDFGELVFLRNQSHAGVILCRIQSLPLHEAVELVLTTIKKYGVELKFMFTVIQPNNIRIRKI